MNGTQENINAVLPNEEMLRQYLDEGFTLYAQCWREEELGFCLADWHGERLRSANKLYARIRKPKELSVAIDRGVKVFQFLPSERDFLCLCLEMDVFGSSFPDGFCTWKHWLKKNKMEYDLLEKQKVWCDTPSGGMHYYFRDNNIETEKYKQKFDDGVTVFGRGIETCLVAAGSVVWNRPYRLEGCLEDAGELPIWLWSRIAEKDPILDKARNEADGISVETECAFQKGVEVWNSFREPSK